MAGAATKAANERPPKKQLYAQLLNERERTHRRRRWRGRAAVHTHDLAEISLSAANYHGPPHRWVQPDKARAGLPSRRHELARSVSGRRPIPSVMGRIAQTRRWPTLVGHEARQRSACAGAARPASMTSESMHQYAPVIAGAAPGALRDVRPARASPTCGVNDSDATAGVPHSALDERRVATSLPYMAQASSRPTSS